MMELVFKRLTMKEIKLCIDTQEFSSKPSSEKLQKYEDYFGNPRSEIQIISNRIAGNVASVNHSQLLTAIENGKTICPSIFSKDPKSNKFRRKEELWIESPAIVLDFDKDIDYKYIIKTLNNHGIIPNIIHKTFSWQPNLRKYHVWIIFEYPIVDKIEYYLFSYYLESLFKGILDTACIDPARLFFSGFSNCHVFSNDVRNDNNILRNLIGSDIKRYVNEKYGNSRNSRELFISGNMDDIDFSGLSDAEALKKQKEALSHLDLKTRQKIAYKIETELRLLTKYKGQFSCRYNIVWNTSRALGQIGPLAPNILYKWIREAIAKNPYFNDYDKNVHDIVTTGIKWGRNHLNK